MRMKEYVPRLNEIDGHESQSAKATEEFDAQLQVLHRLITGVALVEVEYRLHIADPKLAEHTGHSLTEIEAGIAVSRDALDAGVKEAIRIRRLGLTADHAADQARQELLGGNTGEER